MPIRNFVNKAVKRSKVLAETGNVNLTKKIIANGLKPGSYIYNKAENTLTFSELDLMIRLNSEAFFLDAYQDARELKKTLNATFERDAANEITISIGDLKLYIKTAEELYILTEIFCKGAYNILMNKSAVFIDIGMNVAFTSLFFATFKNIKKVIAFEPLKPTMDHAKRNISLNNSISEKIQVNNYGLSDADSTVEIEYTPSFRGSVGVDGISEHVKNLVEKEEIIKEKIILKKASDVIDSICEDHINELKILKVDCEGSEYQVIPELASAGTLKKIDFILMEWHHKGPEPLVKLLKESGFAVISHDAHSRFGQVYAFNLRHL